MKIAIIGCGQMGGYYTNNLINKCKFPAADIVCFDRKMEKALELQQKYGISARSRFPNNFDAAIVATNTPSHHEVVVKLAQAGVKHILCEKPLAQTMKGVGHIRRNCGESKIYTALVINFSPALKFLVDLMGAKDLRLLDFYGRWGKNRGRATEKRPTAGDMEDEAVHVVGALLMLADVGVGYTWVDIDAQLGWLPYVNAESQTAMRKLDDSFPTTPNHATAVNLRLSGFGQVLKATIHSSFLLPRETRVVGGVLGLDDKPVYSFEISFDEKQADKTKGAPDILYLTEIATDKVEQKELAGDKLNDLTQAFLAATQGATPDPRLIDLAGGSALVDIAELMLRSDKFGNTCKTRL